MFTLILELFHFDLLRWLKYSSSSAPTALLSWWSLGKGSSLALQQEMGTPLYPCCRTNLTYPAGSGQPGLLSGVLCWVVSISYIPCFALSGFTLDYQNPFLVPVKPTKQSWWENQELKQIIFVLNVPSKMKNTFLRSLKISEKGSFTNSVM